jgi:hypothetical protein
VSAAAIIGHHVNAIVALRGDAVNARRPRGTRGRSTSGARASARHAESIDGAELSGSIDPVMAGRHAAAYGFAMSWHSSQGHRRYTDVVFESLEHVERVGSGKIYTAFSDEELRDIRDSPASTVYSRTNLRSAALLVQGARRL